MDDELLNLVSRLDGMLTGRTAEAQKNAQQRSYMFLDATTFLLDVISNTYYLSDGGYSRLLFDDDTGLKGVDSISRSDVKRRWQTPEIKQASLALNQYLLSHV